MSFTLATTLLGTSAHLAGFKREADHDEVVQYLTEARSTFPKCPKFDAMLSVLNETTDKWVAGGAMKCAREIVHILEKKVQARAEAKASAPKASEASTDFHAEEEAPAPAPEEEAPAPKVNKAALAKAHAEAEARIAAEAKAPKAKAKGKAPKRK